MRSELYALSALPLLIASGGCGRDENARSVTRPVSGDSLAQDEVLPGRDQAFGLELPRGLRVISRHDDVVQMRGPLKPESVVNFFRERVAVQHVELGPNRTVFPRAYLKGDKTKRVYRIDVSGVGGQTTVKMRDITPPPVAPGLSEPQRWERAGRNPDGTLKDRKQVY
jgi:hypothetical protein